MEGFAQLAVSAGVTTIFHPISYAKVLIQLGYEPVNPVQTKTLLSRPALCYPNVFKYLGLMKERDGFFGMYRGLSARLAGGMVGTYVTGTVSVSLRGEKTKFKAASVEDEVDGDDDVLQAIKNMCYETSIETVSRCSGTLVSQPFHVIMVKYMAQYITGENTGILECIHDTWKNEGILGFFAGLVPRLLGDVLTIWLANTLAFILNEHVLKRTQGGNDMRSYTGAICSLAVTQMTYPLNLISNIMAANHNLANARPAFMPLYDSWLECGRQLMREGSYSRGSSLFFRYYKGRTVLLNDGTLVPVASSWS